MGKSNVQVAKGMELDFLTLKTIKPDPRFPTIRGRVTDTTDLQASIKEVGVLVPVHVWPDENNPGEYLLISGARRLVAARQVGLETIPALVDFGVDENKVRRMMLASDMHEKHPHLVMDKGGRVIGGNCWGVYHEVEGGTDRKDLAPWMGVSTDVIGAYFQLYHEIPEIQAKVVKGDLGITVYALIKHQPQEVREFVAKKRGRITARWVRQVLRHWREIEADLADDTEDDEENPEPAKADYVVYEPGQADNIPLLNQALTAISQVQPTENPIEWNIINRIEAQIVRLVVA